MTIYFNNYLKQKNVYEFSLFPVLAITKTKWNGLVEYDLLIGIWFWGIEINWKRKRKL